MTPIVGAVSPVPRRGQSCAAWWTVTVMLLSFVSLLAVSPAAHGSNQAALGYYYNGSIPDAAPTTVPADELADRPVRAVDVDAAFIYDGPTFTYATNGVDDLGGFANARSVELQNALPAGSQGRVTMSAGVVEDAAGNRITVIGTSEPGGYLRPGVRDALKPGEVVVGGTGHAEVNIVRWAQENGYRVVTVGLGRPHCALCVDAITGAGGSPASPIRP